LVTELLEDKGWKWLEGEYENIKTHIKVMCDIGHKFWVSMGSIKALNGCARCSGKCTDPEFHTDQLEGIITGHGAEWVAGEYEGSEVKIFIRYHQGHEF